MNKLKLLAIGASVFLVGRLTRRRHAAEARPTVGVGTVVDAEESDAAAGEREIWIEVASVHGDTFVGRLVHDDSDPETSMLRPGLVVLVAFDPAARERLSLPDDVLAVRARSLTLV
ncbi:hypothetical protein AWC22_03685 [Mycobacterium riyadhense]|uniref:Uncharacterized protein n=2 Tax=Mycobacterium riyadhense TaxID=486698 RepID=A0A1X2BHB3_9MYCO|nr:hypothetical protein [Mycobacterium riyadhense]MCV7146035.1 hypothetical protein [Mycobacterium riyadhense]ORW63060.1 hypothetical protein AWC22_03685 [Mycobacterium riyadhense]VTO99958.1 hypothetical protein BIN_B_03232 [Mycobacterium riyadhense]